ncbi:Serine/arginine-rich splicing factor SC35 [Striga hermonthica]|uniref:Serine/arginine-rich splicing factor SC35 n=1 Tax=Striga hermonthica TaxID=68872 RepID=A0A9N7NRX1_STRHE|nr:Serine/arginine-rich splicing factor SC35 [Striga hermonthica]
MFGILRHSYWSYYGPMTYCRTPFSLKKNQSPKSTIRVRKTIKKPQIPNPSFSILTRRKKMSHFGRSGPPDIRDTYSLLVLNITFRTTADDLFPLFDKYGKVVDVFIPRDRRTGDSRGFAFVRYKYQDEAQKAVEKLDGRVVDGREIMVQFAKYGPNAERITKGRIEEPIYKSRGRSRSRSPRPRSDYRDRDYRRRSRSRSRGKYERDRHRGRDKDSRYRSRSRSRSLSRSVSPDYRRERGRDKYDGDRRRRSRSYESGSPPPRRSPSPRKSPSPVRSSSPLSRGGSPGARNLKERSITPKSVSPRTRYDSRSRSPRSEADD